MKFINKDFYKTRVFKICSLVLAAVLVALMSFAAGAKFGFDRAFFMCNLSHNYERNFIGQRGGSWNEISGRNAIGMHGIVGEVLSVGTSTLTVSDRDNLEKAVLVTASTSIKSMNNNISLADIKVDSKVVIFGRPNDRGEIQASMIRLVPENIPDFGPGSNLLVPPPAPTR
jgi:hypothetical protein